MQISTEERDRIAREWLARTLASHPPGTARFLAETRDRFRNPVGYAFKQGLPALLDELLGEMNAQRTAAVLDEIVRIRAVQESSPSRALAFIFLLKEIVRDPELHGRIDRLALQAFDVYMACREQLYEIRVKEARRQNYLLERVP